MPRWLLAVLFISGCSFGLSGPKPDRPRSLPPVCSTSRGLIILDGVAGSIFGLTAIGFATTSEPAIALLPAAVAAVYLGAVISGNQKVNECNKAVEEYQVAYAHPKTLPREDTEPPPKQEQRAEAPPPPATAVPPPVAKAPEPKAPPKTAEKDDEWGEFWREVSP